MVEIIKVAQIFEEEKIAYGKEMAEQAAEKTAKKVARNITENLLRDGMSPEKVVQIISDITLEEVEALEKELLQIV